LMKLLIPYFPILQHLLDVTVLVMSLLPVLIGVMVGISFNLTPIQTASVGIAAMVGSGAVEKTAVGLFALNGIGIVVNTGITAALAVLFIKWIGDGLKDYSILLIPSLNYLVPGMIGYMILPFVIIYFDLIVVSI